MKTRSVSRAPRRLRSALVLAVLSTAVVGTSAHAGMPIAARQCAAAKRRLVGMTIAARTACDAMAVAKGVAIDPTCAAKAKARFIAAWDAIEKAADGACITSDDADDDRGDSRCA